MMLGRADQVIEYADILLCGAHVRFRGQSGDRRVLCKCLLLTQSGHQPAFLVVVTYFTYGIRRSS